MNWKSIFPPLKWIKDYSRAWLKGDIITGITMAAYGIPVSMAYANLAGLPVQYGIYGYFIGGIFYALFGTARQLAIGPTSAISLLIGSTLSTLANGDIQHWIMSHISHRTDAVYACCNIGFNTGGCDQWSD